MPIYHSVYTVASRHVCISYAIRYIYDMSISYHALYLYHICIGCMLLLYIYQISTCITEFGILRLAKEHAPDISSPCVREPAGILFGEVMPFFYLQTGARGGGRSSPATQEAALAGARAAGAARERRGYTSCLSGGAPAAWGCYITVGGKLRFWGTSSRCAG